MDWHFHIPLCQLSLSLLWGSGQCASPALWWKNSREKKHSWLVNVLLGLNMSWISLSHGSLLWPWPVCVWSPLVPLVLVICTTKQDLKNHHTHTFIIVSWNRRIGEPYVGQDLRPSSILDFLGKYAAICCIITSIESQATAVTVACPICDQFHPTCGLQ